MIQAGNAKYGSTADFPDTIAIFPLTGALLLPGGNMPLNIFEPRYLKMVEDAMHSDRLIGMIQPCLRTASKPVEPPPLSKIGCVGRITACQETGDGRLMISLAGIARFQITEEIETNHAYRKVTFEIDEADLHQDCSADQVDRDAVLGAFRAFLDANDMEADWETVNDTDNDTLVTALCMMSPFDPADKQAMLEAPNLKARAETLVTIAEFHLACKDDDNRPSVQ